MGHSTHADLYWEFRSALKEFDSNNMIEISIDLPNLNINYLNDLAKDCVANEQPELIFIVPCGLHVIHGAFKTGAESTDWKMKKIFKAAFQIFHDSHARHEDYKSITGCDLHPRNFCVTR